MGFSLKIEYVALILNCVLLFFYYEKNMHLNFKKKCFLTCLGLSMFAIIVNILSVLTLGKVSDTCNFFFNALYYPAIMGNASALAFFLFYLMFEHVPQRKCSKIAYSIIGTFLAIVVIMTIANFWTGCLFTVENGIYSRGPLNTVGYVGVGVELCLLVVCYFRNRRYINASMTRLIEMLPVAVVVLLLIQLTNRDIMMNGIISAIANLILFIISQTSRMEEDSLTELKNRTACIADMNGKIRKNMPFQFVTVNLKDFSAVNRKFGHNVGDEFLYQIARYLETTFREGEVYRVGGVEFVILIPYVSMEYAVHCCDEIYKRLQEKWEVKEVAYILRAGICDMICEKEVRDASQLIEQMQYAQGIVKEKKETRIMHFDDSVLEHLERRKYLISRMKRAMKEDGFEMYFQPIYSWKEKSFLSMEALLRLRDEDGTLISPAEFIPVAEEVGLIDQIGWIVLDKVCAFMSNHSELEIRTASVNMSMQQFMGKGFADKVEACLQKYALPPERIRIEITERMISENPQQTRETLHRLTEKGILFYLDDFGMGYSNFAGVLSLPIETIKLDLTLVHGAFESERKLVVLESLIAMLSRAGYSIVAEGIETEEQANTLRVLGADRLQGFYYHRPMPESEIIRLFEK
ncbi:MAG: bifunctional diguanylate cyclase/phosphodiesterase [Anaerotignum sp.]|nr:bifunctional diguanylate cyclase/phosphodiesterase [Anaerotignum sp.]